MLRNYYSHLSLVSFQYIDDHIESNKAFAAYENSVVRHLETYNPNLSDGSTIQVWGNIFTRDPGRKRDVQ